MVSKCRRVRASVILIYIIPFSPSTYFGEELVILQCKWGVKSHFFLTFRPSLGEALTWGRLG